MFHPFALRALALFGAIASATAATAAAAATAGLAIFTQSARGVTVLLAFRRCCKVLAFRGFLSAFAAFRDRG
jgi:hypothetical protein